MINNFDQIADLLEFPNKDNFYFVQLLQRKKDHPGQRLGGSNNNSRLIKAYYITSVEKLHIHQEEMIKLCEVFNARACINLNPRNFEKAAFHCLQKIANQMSNKDFFGVRKAYDSVCGEFHQEIDRRWLVDIDTKDVSIAAQIRCTIEELQHEITNRDYKVLTTIETKSGYHLITHPFNLQKFSQRYPEIEVHKNNPTALYIP